MSHNPQHLPIPGRKNICAFLTHVLLPIHVRRIPKNPEMRALKCNDNKMAPSLSCVCHDISFPQQKEDTCVQHTCGQRFGLLQRVAACPSQRDMAPRVRLTALVNRFSSQPAHRYAANTTRKLQHTQHVRFNAITSIGNAVIQLVTPATPARTLLLLHFLAPSLSNASYPNPRAESNTFHRQQIS
jgi:hypothetical protein